MRVKDIYSEVARLGFDTLLEDNTAFYQTLNRALLQTAYDLPDKKRVNLRHEPLKNLLGNEQLCKIYRKPTNDELVIGSANNVKAYYFECSGNGYAYIESLDRKTLYNGPIALESSGKYKSYRGIIKSDGNFIDASARVQIRFEGDYSFNVTNVAFFGDVISEHDKDVQEFTTNVVYDMRTVASDFLSFASPVIECVDGIPLKDGYEIVGDHMLYLPYFKEGVYYVNYNARPEVIAEKTNPLQDEQEIELSQEASTCIALLIASYLWLDDDSDLATYYRTLYQDCVTKASARERNRTPVRYITNGW